MHNYTADRYRGGGINCIVVGGGGLSYKSSVRVVLPVIATARAFAPSSPILLQSRLKRGGRIRRWLNNVVLMHLHYTADRYRVGGYCIVVGGKSGFGDWCRIGW